MKVGLSEVGSNWFKRQAKQFQNSVLPRSFHLRQNFCLPRACIDVKSMSEKKKMKSYLVECLSTRSTLKKTVQKKSLKKKTVFFMKKKNARLGKKKRSLNVWNKKNTVISETRQIFYPWRVLSDKINISIKNDDFVSIIWFSVIFTSLHMPIWRFHTIQHQISE